MPELPEVEVTRLCIAEHLVGSVVTGVSIRSPKLHAMVPEDLERTLAGKTVETLTRRGKYLLFGCGAGTLLMHLGMTGHLRLVPAGRPPGPHDHLDLHFNSGVSLRLNDTRKFGGVYWTEDDPLRHKLLADIGPEPLTDALSADYLYRRSRGRKVALQRFLMDSSIVAGLGNIYAAETAFRCSLLPTTPVSELSQETWVRLLAAIREVLSTSIATGTRAMDFCRVDAQLAYFSQRLYVYGREGEPCLDCGTPIARGRLGNRSTFFCPVCQK